MHGLHDALVDPEADGPSQGEEAEVSDDGDEGERRQRQEGQHRHPKHHPALLRVPPVQQRLH